MTLICQAEDAFWGELNGSHCGNELGQTAISYTVTFLYVSWCPLPNVVSLHLCLAPEWQNIWIYLISSTKGGFLVPWGQKAPSWEWSLRTCYGPVYQLSGNTSEKNLAENILRVGPGSRPIAHCKITDMNLPSDHTGHPNKPFLQCKCYHCNLPSKTARNERSWIIQILYATVSCNTLSGKV